MPEPTYALRDLLLPELKMELAKTRKSLERVADAQNDFKPHEKSMTLMVLANHLTTVSGFAGNVLQTDVLDMGTPSDPRRIVKEPTAAARLAAFDEMAAKSLEAMAAMDDAGFAAKFELTKQGAPVFAGTRYGALRQIAMNHMMHHRAQLGVYLRLLNVPVPGLFGPSADES